LPEDLVPDGSGNPLRQDEGVPHLRLPKCGRPARARPDTMDTFVDRRGTFFR